MEYEARRPGLAILAGVLAVILVALLVVAALEPWDDRVSVRFVTYGGDACKTLKVQPGTVLSQSGLPKPGKTGQRFAGWCVDKEATVFYSGAPIDASTTLYAAYVKAAAPEESALGQVFLTDVGQSFGVNIQSDLPLTEHNLSQHVLVLTYHGEAAAPVLEPLAEGLYRLTANYAEAGAYGVQLLTPQVRFAPDQSVRDITPDTREIFFYVPGENHSELALLGEVGYVKSESLLDANENAMCVAGRDPYKPGDVVRLPIGDDDNYYAVARVIYQWEAGQLGLELPQNTVYTCYALRPAQSGEVFRKVQARLRQQLLEDQLIPAQQLKQQVTKALEGNLVLDELADLMIAGAQESEEYQAFSRQQLGSVVPVLPTAQKTDTRIRVGIATNKLDHGYFTDMTGYDVEDLAFHSITIQATKQVPVTNAAGETLVVEADIQVTYWFHVHADLAVQGTQVMEFDAAVTTLTHTVAQLDLRVSTPDGKQTLELGGIYERLLDKATQDVAQAGDFRRLYTQVLGSNRVVLLDQEVAQLSYTAGLLELSLPVRLELALELGGAWNAQVEMKTADVVGVRGDTEKGYYSYCYSADPSLRMEQMGLGHNGLRAGVRLDGKVRFLGLKALGEVTLQARTGAWTELYGYHYLNYDRKGDADAWQAAGAYYGQLGLYRDVGSQATVLEKQYPDEAYGRVLPLAQLGSRRTVTALECREEVTVGKDGLAGDQLPVTARTLDLVTGRTGAEAADAASLQVYGCADFRVREGRVVYTGKDEVAQGVLPVAYCGSSAAFNQALVVRVPVGYDAQATAPAVSQPAQVQVYTFHVLDPGLREQVCTVTVPEGVLPQVEDLTVAPEGLRFAGWYPVGRENLVPVQPGINEYFASYEKE